MTKAEARKIARLEAENAELRATVERFNSRHFEMIRKASAYALAMREIVETIEEARRFAE